MLSPLPKVLIPFAGVPILERTLAVLRELGSQPIAVVPSDASAFEPIFEKFSDVLFCAQNSQKGTADAVAAAHVFFPEATKPSYADGSLLKGKPLSGVSLETPCLLMAGDLPCITAEILAKFKSDFSSSEADIGVLGFEPPEPTGFGRLVCTEAGQLTSIVEEKDACSAQKELRFCNSGIILVKFAHLFSLLNKVGTKNAQNEYYLTDIIELAVQDGLKVAAMRGEPWQALSGVNTKEQLQRLEQWSLRE